jgi:UDP-4-amino-4,6-dideoxy-N-acetyl-beta-L-altrosamine transaminase
VLRSDFLTQGPVVPQFEAAICSYVGSEYAVAVNSGTSALHIACLALGLGPGDWLWTTPVTFVASANCGLYCGARVDFVDIDPECWNISIEALTQKLERARRSGKLPKVLVAVHLCGLSCEMAALHALSRTYGFSVIEDACHAIGGRYQEELVGNCRYSDIAVFSFHPVKNFTTGEGGMAVTNSRKLAGEMELLRSHGITRNPELMSREVDGLWSYEQLRLGFNYRMSDINAALGKNQLKRLDRIIARKRQIAVRYDELFRDLPLKLPHHSSDSASGLHLYVVRMDEQIHKGVFARMREAGIGVNLHYIPVHTQPYYQALGFSFGDFPQAEQYYKEAMSLPIYPELTQEQQDRVVRELKNAIFQESHQ